MSKKPVVELLENIIRKIIREELDFYSQKIIKEVMNNPTPLNETKNTSIDTPYSLQSTLRESFSRVNPPQEKHDMTFDNMEVPEELSKVFNRDYSQLMKKINK